jgi:hypothetical protein
MKFSSWQLNMIGEDPITGGIGWTVDGELSTVAVRIEPQSSVTCATLRPNARPEFPTKGGIIDQHSRRDFHPASAGISPNRKNRRRSNRQA